jgi:predicted nucleic acid-binding protein
VTVVVDASIAVKWVVPEVHALEASILRQRWLDDDELLIAPPPFKPEVTNALFQKVRRSEIAQELARAALGIIVSTILIRETPDLYDRGVSIACELGVTATYDSLYLTLAEAEGCEFWTADRRFVNSVGKRYPYVRWVGEVG